MKDKGNSMLYFVGSVLLIIVAIVFTAILDSTRGSEPSGDIRARAGNLSTVNMSGTISSADETQGVLVVDNLQFKRGTKKNLGTWTVTPPASYTLSRAVPGKKITLAVDPTTFIAMTHTLTATSLK